MSEDGRPLIDIGMPTHGRPEFLREAIESVLAQTLTSWRLVISDDGPGSSYVAATVEPYLEDPRVEYVVTGHKLGAPGNHSASVAAGSAPFIAFLHHDDRWAPGFLARRAAFFEEHSDCGLVFSGNTVINEAGVETGRTPGKLPQGIYSPKQFLPMLLRSNIIAVPTVLVRRAAYDAVGGSFDERFPLMFDYELWVRIAARFPTGYLAVWDADYRRHDDAMTYQTRGWGEQWLRFLDHAEAIARRDLPVLELGQQERRRRRSGAYLTAALDAVERREPRTAFSLLVRAVGRYPPSVLDPRMPAAIGSVLLGAPGRNLLARLRRVVLRRGIRLHRRR
jgi:glycosyltransferase involved in cell wall biosynthesis